ncbi:hypothetical protein OHB15_03305 [Streptosporangium subroseum]|nr:hypothetical protein OHB15_03305 [Streptosporangium subroseum]
MWTELAVGDTLMHFDPRFDNILISPCGTAHLVNWGRACIGPAWGDLVCLLLQPDLGDVDPEEIFVGHPVGEAAEPEQVDAFLVALAGYWTHTASLPELAHAPHLGDRREYSPTHAERRSDGSSAVGRKVAQHNDLHWRAPDRSTGA